jgi:hypothetical protein
MVIYENICRERSFDNLISQFDEVHKVKNWNDDIPESGVFLGSIAGCNWMKENRPNVKFWSTFENYKCSAYYPKIQELLFNDKYVFVPFKDLARRKWDLYSWLGDSALIFVRPDSGEKDTPAKLLDIQDVDKFVNDYDYEGMVVVSTPKIMVGEWRFVVSKKKVHAVSLYKYQDILSQVPSAPDGAYSLVEKVFEKDYEPDEIFCVDVVQDSDENFWVMELTSFSSAGLYACDIVKVSNLIKQYL